MKLRLSIIALALSAAACSHTAPEGATAEKTAATTPCSISITPRELEANPLLLGAHMDDVEGIRCLLQHGANPNAADDTFGNTLLMVAAGADKTGAVTRLFLENTATNANIVNNSGNTALMYAARFGRTDAVRQLLARGVDLDTVNNEGQTALSLAMKNGHTDIVQMLKTAGAKQ